MAALTDVDIANMALTLLTEAHIETRSEDSRAARLINLHFDVTREAELMRHAWSFAVIFPADIPAVDSGLDGEFRYLYAVPPDFLRPVWMTRDGLPDGVPITWSTWADGIRADFAGPLKMPYVANLTDPNDWPALFTQVLVAALAIPIAHAMTGKEELIRIAQAAYNTAIDQATTVNAFLKAGRPFVPSWAVQRGDYRNWRA